MVLLTVGRVHRRATRKSNRAVLVYGRVHPEKSERIGVAEVDLSRGAVERLDPDGDPCAVVAAEEKRLAVRHPDCSYDIAIDRASDLSSFAASGGGDFNIFSRFAFLRLNAPGCKF